MTVDTKTVAGRRTVSYQSYDDLLADAERLSQCEVTMVGNWSLAQVLDHLGRSLDASIDGTGFKMPLPMRLMGTFLFKNKFLNVAIPPGFKIGKSVQSKFAPEETVTVEEGLDQLRRAVDRCKNDHHRADHPLFGELTYQEWDKFSLRHAEMHMSFAVPLAT